MKNRIPTAVSLAVLLGTWCAATARATTLVRLSLEQLTEASSAIVRGHVVSQESGWNPAHTHIFTTTTIAVDQALKGNVQPEVVIEQLGGKLGHRREHVAGTVHFFPQASYWLFLEPAAAGTGRYMVVGMAQGAYRIYQDPATHEDRVIRPFGGVFYGTRDPAQGAAPLKEFRHELATALEAPMFRANLGSEYTKRRFLSHTARSWPVVREWIGPHKDALGRNRNFRWVLYCPRLRF